MSSAKPTRKQSDLADVLELVLDKGIVINADIAVTVGETELLGVEIRAAIASFETAAEYGLAFPSGTDMRRVEQASGREPLEVENEEDEVNLGISASEGGSNAEDDENASSDPPSERPDPEVPIDTDDGAQDESEDEGSNGDGNGNEEEVTSDGEES
ncbi:gas vesicle protein GvpJ [Halalkalicoccus subterraneus]|uniref:gas vesicle protein GvpJ n=1 Tax=Halalkalicoccus subterraneus TaxID=2675002 RepID=UPI000EFA6CAD|nr:gas vesicle protein [Halalkalicoccus subterraneus]